jgi:hypothetical protein
MASKVYPFALHSHEGEARFGYYPKNTVMSGVEVGPERDVARDGKRSFENAVAPMTRDSSRGASSMYDAYDAA